MDIELFAGTRVADFAAALDWYEKLFGFEPFLVGDTEGVWEIAEHRSVFIEHDPDHAGHARHLLLVDDLDATIADIAARGLEPMSRETYDNGVRKANYLDPDGNEFGFGQVPS